MSFETKGVPKSVLGLNKNCGVISLRNSVSIFLKS